MKKTWICLGLSLALCLPLAGCAGDKTGSVTPSPTAGVTGAPSGTTSGQPVVTGAPDEDHSAAPVTPSGAQNTDPAAPTQDPVERMGEGVEDTLDDLAGGARRMAQDAKRAMQ